ncbi:MAG: hypothetical protein V4515_14970 [Chloroflexota bacterium]
MATFVGTIPTFSAGGKLRGSSEQTLALAMAALSSLQTDYSASLVWFSSGVNPTIGNGTISATYLQVNGLVNFKGAIVAGSTTTFGTLDSCISLPVAATLGNRNTGGALINDTSTPANDRPAALEWLSSTSARFISSTGRVNATTPFTFAVGDSFHWNVWYEADV